jgi:hypothetical protein
MQRQTLLLIVAGGLVVAALIFMGWAATRSLTPAAEAPTAAATPATATPSPAARPAAEGIIVTELFTMTLPAGWQYTLQEWRGEPPVAAEALAPRVTAWQGGDTFEQSPNRFSIATLPRNELELEQYVIDVTEQLSSAAGVSAVTAEIVTDLRRDALPVALIRYTMATPAGEVKGLQAAMLDAAGTQLIVATLVQRGDGADPAPFFRTLIGALHFLEPAPAGSPGG